jgi:hypothetical protein
MNRWSTLGASLALGLTAAACGSGPEPGSDSLTQTYQDRTATSRSVAGGIDTSITDSRGALVATVEYHAQTRDAVIVFASDGLTRHFDLSSQSLAMTLELANDVAMQLVTARPQADSTARDYACCGFWPVCVTGDLSECGYAWNPANGPTVCCWWQWSCDCNC